MSRGPSLFIILVAFLPLGGNATELISSNAGFDIKDTVARMKDVGTALPGGKLEIGDGRSFNMEPGNDIGRDYYSRQTRPEVNALCHNHVVQEIIKSGN